MAKKRLFNRLKSFLLSKKQEDVVQFEKYNFALSQLTRSRAIAVGNLERALKEITEVCANILNVERVSVWKYDRDKGIINCLNLFEKTKKSHSEGLILTQLDFPSYFQYIQGERILAAEDARANAATSEFAESYLKPLNIFSMLDVPIWSAGDVGGILCIENVGYKRKWTLSEQTFVSSLASLVSNAFEADYKNQAQINEVILREEIQSLNAFTHLINSLSNLNEIFVEVAKYVYYNYNINNAFLFLPNETSDYLYTYNVHSIDKKFDQTKTDFIFSQKIPLKEGEGGILYKVFQRKKSFFLRKVPKFEFAIDKKFAEQLSIHSFLYLPLIRKEECIGIFGFSNLESKLYLSKEDIRKLTNLCSQIAGSIDTHHLLQKMDRARKESEGLNELMKNINSVSSLVDIMSFVMYYLETEYKFYDYCLLLNDSSKEVLSTFSFTSPRNLDDVRDYFLKFKFSSQSNSGVFSALKDNKKSIYLEKSEIPNTDSVALEWVNKGKFDYVFLLPLVIYDELIGVLFLHSPISELKLTESIRLQLEKFSDLIAGSIFNATLLKKVEEAKLQAELEKSIAQQAQVETEKARREIQNLNKITKEVNSVSSLTDVMTFIMYYLEKEYSFTDFWMLITSEREDSLQNFSFVSPEVDSSVYSYFQNFQIHLEEDSILNTSFREQKIFYLPVEGNSNLSEIDKKIIKISKFRYFLLIPFVIYEQTIGILLVHSNSNQVISEEILKKLQSFSNQMAGAVNNSKLYKIAQEAKEEADIAKKEAEKERDKSEKLLLNILPRDVAKELKEKGFAEPVLYESVSVLFTDFKGFTKVAETLSPQELIKDLDGCFVQFDKITERFNLEKLKTIGDSYMCAGGIPVINKTHPIDSCLAALEIQEFMAMMKNLKTLQGYPYWELRLGIHTGPLIAGVIGEKKFAYDVWGDTVNIASRMESSGTPQRINISGVTYNLVKEVFDCEYRGEIDAKNKGKVEMYYLNRLKKEFSKDEEGRVPNGKFWQYYAGLE